MAHKEATRKGRNGGRLKSGQSPEKASEYGKRPRKLPDLSKAVANALGEEQKGLTALDALLRAHLAKAIKGDARSADLILGYAYGKATQRQEISGANGEAVKIELVLRKPETPNQTDLT